MPPSTLPTPTSLPSTLNPILHPPSQTTSPSQISNAILFLHGLGDTSPNFSQFARALNLPETLTITLQGLTPLPFPLPQGFHWGDDVVVDQSSGDLDPDSGFERARRMIGEEVVKKVLMKECGFTAREILIFGFGQGGLLGLAVAKDLAASGGEFGGVVSIGGGVPESARLISGEKAGTPVLLLGGSRGVFAKGDGTAVKAAKGTFRDVEYHQWKKGDDSMPKNREEALPMMQFFARRLRSRKGVPGGAVEIG